jgi:cell division transport system permease protein
VPLAWSDILAVIPCPLLAALVAAVAAQVTAIRLIRDMQ